MTAVELNQVGVTIQDQVILKDINFSINPGSFTGIIGPNGAGKTTILKLILGLLAPSQGQVKVFGQNPRHFKSRSYQVGYLPQKTQFDRKFPIHVLDMVLMGLTGSMGFFKLPGPQHRQLAYDTMEQVGILELKDQPLGTLSGGQQQLVFLTSALVAKPDLLVMDEPTSALDPMAQHNFYQLIQRIQQQTTMTVMVVSHDLAAIAANAQQLICINQTMHLHGDSRDVMAQLTGQQHYRCEFDVLFNSGNWGQQP